MRHALRIIKLRFERTWWIMLLLAGVGAAAGGLVWHLGLFGISDQELGAYDSGLQAWTKGGPLSKDVVVVAIDDLTFSEIDRNPSYRREYGAWPYARSIWARVFQQLAADGARAVVFDAVLTESNSDPGNDDNMARAIAANRLPVYVGFAFGASGRALPHVVATNRLAPAEAPPAAKTEAGSGDEAFPDAAPEKAAPSAADDARAQQALEAAASALVFPVEATGLALPELPDEPVVDVAGRTTGTRKVFPMPPMASLLPVLPGFGMVESERDGDGKVRTTRFAYSDGANRYVTLSVALAADLLGADKLVLEPNRLTLGARTLAINSDGSAGIDFGGTLKQRFRTVSLIHVLDDFHRLEHRQPRALAADWAKGKVVLIGGFAAGTSDEKATPFERSAPGVTKHAAEIDSLLSGRFIVDAPFWASLLLTFGVALFSAMVILIVKQPLFELGFPIALFFLFYLVPGWVLVTYKLHVLSAMPGLAGSIASVAAAAFNHFFADEEREVLRETFGRYMEKSLVDQMVEGHRLPPLDGVNKEVTAFFSDIKGFTSFSEQFRDDPKTLMKVLNRYLTQVTDVLVNQEQATLDKYVGDSVVALFSAPLDQPDHPVRACRAALAVQEAVARLRVEFAAKGWPDVFTRIGLNTGHMMVGNLGSAQLVDYTAIGDEMNLASRLEGANKSFGTAILIGPATYEAAQHKIEARELDLIRVEGKQHPVRVYELLAMRGWLPPAKRTVLGLYAKALELYRAARFDEALSVLEELLKHDPGDGPAKFLKARCDEFLLHPPPQPFEAVTQLTK